MLALLLSLATGCAPADAAPYTVAAEPLAVATTIDTQHVWVAGVEYVWVAPWFDLGTLRWVEGYWRPVARVGYVWVDGAYTLDGVWAPGRWIPAPPARPVVLHHPRPRRRR